MAEMFQGFIPNRDEMEKAASRITSNPHLHGGMEPAALAWLLSFLSQNVFKLKDWEREEALWNVLRFGADCGQPGADYGQSGAFAFQMPEGREAIIVALSEIQRILLEALDRYLVAGIASFPEEPAGFTIVRGSPSLLFNGRSLRAAFCYMAAQLLVRYGHRITRCEGCSILMLRGRKDQRFHSKTCQIGSFVRKKRAADKEKRLAEAQRKARRKKARTITKGGNHGKKR